MLVISKKIPIMIHPFFWVFAALIGWMMSPNILGMAIWIFIIFVSVLFHELGHALMAMAFKQKPRIQLVALGGLTSYEGKNLNFGQQFLIVLNGPVFGLILFGLMSALLWIDQITNPLLLNTIKILQFVNFIWSVLNLVPIIPLDGGQLLRIALEAFLGVKGFKISLIVSLVLALLTALFFFAAQNILMGSLFFLFAFQSFDMYKKAKNLSSFDRKEVNADELRQGEVLFEDGKKDEAKKIFEDIRHKTKEGLLFIAATHYLALIEYEDKNNLQSYNLLLSIKDKLTDEAACLLHKLAFEEKNYELVTELGSNCYKYLPTEEVALNNARAYGELKQPTFAGGWLQTAHEYGHVNFEEIILEKFFDNVRESEEFKVFIKKTTE
ncbi:MAG: M50 family metallopeptidase [Chlamydiae bacterium]|nr:M50 family metallopeptidase [Chlamydiota bacterium]